MLMKIQESSAIVMRTSEFGESDLLVTFFSSRHGRLKGIAKGARRSRRRFVNCLDTFSLVSLDYELKKQSELCFLHSGRLLNAYPGIRKDFDRLSRASYMLELCEILFPPGVADKEMFKLMKEIFAALSQGEALESLPIIFELRAMSLGGYGIGVAKCSICGRRYTGRGRGAFKREKGGIACLRCQPETAVCPGMGPPSIGMIGKLQSSPWEDIKNEVLDERQIAEIRPVLKIHREYHLGRRLKTAGYFN